MGTATPEVYSYDNRGNITSGFVHLLSLSYNAVNCLEKAVIDASRTVYYQYDSSGQRVRKTTVNTAASLTESRYYVGSWEVYRRKNSTGAITLERGTLHLSDDTGRVALIDTRTIGTGTEPVQLLRYQLSNHLGSAALETDGAGVVISYEEYYPYGSTSGRSGRWAATKRYRYTGKERDEESGFYYHGARYYVPWLGRWIAADPLESKYAGLSPYNYGFNNPVNWTDSTGMEPDEGNAQKVYAQGEKKTQAMFQAKLNEIQSSNADPGFKEWAGNVGLTGTVQLRDALFKSKMSAYETPFAAKLYGHRDDGTVNVPHEIRKRLWNEAIDETIPTLKATWASMQSGGETSGLVFRHNLNLTISSREEGWDAIRSAGIEVGLQWALHLSGGGIAKPAQRTEATVLKASDIRREIKVDLQISSAAESIPLTKKTFGHTFTTHGEEMTDFLLKRAKGSEMAQGQFLDNQKAAQFILDNISKTGNGTIDILIPKGFPARVIMPNGIYKNPTHIRLVPSGKGVKTAYPLIK